MVSVLRSIRAVVFRRFFFLVLPSGSNSASVVRHGLLREVAALLVEGEDAWLQQPALYAGRRIHMAHEEARRLGRFQAIGLSRAARRAPQNGGNGRPNRYFSHGGSIPNRFPRGNTALSVNAAFGILSPWSKK